eukprot:GEMP01022661.1.p1 GENE.GEMP01022661.1~~GEMP01022661.1.p1  ORF type:complete len:491 (+),score=110.04 GEMP01022661.1:149-1621(+)
MDLNQPLDHFSPDDTRSFQQRVIFDRSRWSEGNDGGPIFFMLGGEGRMPDRFYYPFVYKRLASAHKAAVLQAEHRFYGDAQTSNPEDFKAFLTPQQALADYANLIRHIKNQLKCPKCVVMTIGGSYPGFLSAMMRLRYPHLVQLSYASSAPTRFYAQDVDTFAYYQKVTDAAEHVVPGCSHAVKKTLDIVAHAQSLRELIPVCNGKTLSNDEAIMAAAISFANLNMENYPPTNSRLTNVCTQWVNDPSGTQTNLKNLLQFDDCYDVDANKPAGPNATMTCGDWSGCGNGKDGEMWDFQTCTYLVEKIGFGPDSMFPALQTWSADWLKDHCQKRFGVQPQPTDLVTLWGFESAHSLVKASASRILFVNGVQDGWSTGGIVDSDEASIQVINLENGAHHVELDDDIGDDDTPDVVDGRNKIEQIISDWIAESKENIEQESSTPAPPLSDKTKRRSALRRRYAASDEENVHHIGSAFMRVRAPDSREDTQMYY